MKKFLIVIFLLLLSIGGCSKKEVIEKLETNEKDSAYFESLLFYFLPEASMNVFIDNISSFKDEDITNFVVRYYIYNINHSNAFVPVVNSKKSKYSYKISQSDIDVIVKKYFGDVSYKLVLDTKDFGLKKEKDGYYLYWVPTDWISPKSEKMDITYKNDEALVSYMLTDEANLYNGILTFNLKYNNGNYVIKSIKYIKK